MQDIVIYAAASETLGLVRDYSNMNKSSAPVLTLGSSVCLRIRLFADINTATPYPIAKFEGITDWRWSMDSDFDRRTACKLVADADGISVHTVTDTVNGETMDFTEFVIRISNMNTEELAEWIGNEKEKTGLTGELVGCDNSGNVAFVLQIEDFSVRNIIFGLMDPTAVDEGIVTRSIAERMIQTAVSSSAATKQDKLNPSNGGTGISVSNAGVISVSDIPQSAVTGLSASLTGVSASLAGKQDMLTAGYRTAIVSGSTVEQMRYFAIEPSITAPANQTTAVVLSAGRAYEIHAVASNAKVVLNREEPVGGTRTFGLEGHAEIYLANTGYVQTGSNVVLANALEPDAVNNCTVRFHDGYAIISVEDHVAGYIVTVNAGTTAGSLYYGLTTSTNEYIAVDASLNGQTLDLAGATTYAGEKHVVGNGYEETVISGGITCTSKTTFSNLSMDGVVVSSGNMTFGDVFIPNGATVTMSGGSFIAEKVSGDGGTIDLNGANKTFAWAEAGSMYGVVLTNGVAANGGAMLINSLNNVLLSGCTITGCSAGTYGGAIFAGNSSTLTMSDCLVSGNLSGDPNSTAMFVQGSAVVRIVGGEYFDNFTIATSTESFTIDGHAKLHGVIVGTGTSAGGAVTIASDTIVDLTGNTNASPIAPVNGVTFAPGVATVYPSAGQASAYMLGGMTVPQIGNTNVINLGGKSVDISSGSTASATGCIFGGGNGSPGGAFTIYGNLVLSGVEIDGCDGSFGAVFAAGALELSSCYIHGQTAYYGAMYLQSGTVLMEGTTIGTVYAAHGGITIAGNNTIDQIAASTASADATVTISSGASIDLTSSINPGGGIIIPAGADVHISDNDYNAFGGITASSVNSSGYIGGATVTVPDGATCTYTYWSGGQSTTTSATGPATVVVPGDMSYCGN